MLLAKIILSISIILWLLPPFRQIKGGYFLFFLLLGYSDPLAEFMRWAFKLNSNYVHSVIALLICYTVLYYNKNLNYKWVVPLLLILLFSFSLGNKEIRILTFIGFQLIIFAQILITTTKEIYLKQRINIYFSVLLVYELSVILRYIALVNNYASGIYFFYLTGVFEMFICLFFIFNNLENSPVIKLRSG
jgi:hypothetical protein